MTDSNRVSTCALCHKQEPIRLSHYIPKSIYALLVDDGALPPIQANPERGIIVKTNKQVAKHLLCGGCEQLLSKNGEDYVLRLVRRTNENFAFRDLLPPLLTNLPHRPVWTETDLIQARIDISAVKYFAASIFWRGSVTRWNADTDHYFNALGAEYNELFRKFLLHQGPLPTGFFLGLNIQYDDPPFMMIIFPEVGIEKIKRKTIRLHQFTIPGIKFSLVVSRSIYKACSEKGQMAIHPTHFWLSPLAKDLALQTDKLNPRGKLASEPEFLEAWTKKN